MYVPGVYDINKIDYINLFYIKILESKYHRILNAGGTFWILNRFLRIFFIVFIINLVKLLILVTLSKNTIICDSNALDYVICSLFNHRGALFEHLDFLYIPRIFFSFDSGKWISTSQNEIVLFSWEN